MNKSIKSVIEKLKDHPNVEIFSKKKLGQFVGKENVRTEFKRRQITEIDKDIARINENVQLTEKEFNP